MGLNWKDFGSELDNANGFVESIQVIYGSSSRRWWSFSARGFRVEIPIGFGGVHEGFGLLCSMLVKGFGEKSKVGLFVCDPEQG